MQPFIDMDLDQVRQTISVELKKLFKKATGMKTIPYKNWSKQKHEMKVDLIGWPKEVKFMSAGKLAKEDLRKVFDRLESGHIKFIRVDENTLSKTMSDSDSSHHESDSENES
jgi:hypothetical protein